MIHVLQLSRAWLAIVGGGLVSSAQAASLIYSVNDQATAYVEGKMLVRPQARPGSFSIIDLAASPVRAWHLEDVPGSVVGPPACVAVSANGDDILVTAAQQVNHRSDPNRLVADPRITRLRFDGQSLRQVDQIEVGLQPSGITLDAGGKRAWVALRGEGGIAAIDLTRDEMRLKATWKFADAEDSLSDVAVSPDGRTLLATLHMTDRLLVLRVGEDGGLTEVQRVPLPRGPYHIAFLSDGRALIGCTRDDVVAVLVAGGEGWTLQRRIETGRVPESVEVSPDGRWIAVACFDGANLVNPRARWFGEPPGVYLYRVDDRGEIALAQTLRLTGILQSAVFSSDGRHLVVGQFGFGNLRVFAREESTWIDTGMALEVPGQPAALAVPGH
jgi:Uncharacterized conserved protein